MPVSAKIFVIISIICGTLLYSHYERRKVEKLVDQRLYILKEVPVFKGEILGTGTEVESKQFVTRYPATMVHFWGTWCAPCEVEFPEVLKFAEILESQNVQFLLVAINDTEIKVKKFLKQFGKLGSNVSVMVKQDTELMKRFGTFKVPETYLFSQDGQLLKKYIGPQNWLNPFYFDQVKNFVQ